MTSLQKRICLILAVLLAGQPAVIQAQDFRARAIDYTEGPSTFPNIFNAFKVPDVPDLNLANSNRLDQLIRDGRLYLSLRDALALAIENNLDLEVARYGPLVAGTDVLRSKSGAQLRGVQTQISTLSTGQSIGEGGFVRGAEATGITQRAGAAGGGGGPGGTGDAASFFGTQAVNLDPIVFVGSDWGHFSNPQASDLVGGTNTLINRIGNSNLGVRQGFKTGATATLVWANRSIDTNNLRNNFNPSLRSNLTLQISQPLLRGFGAAVNTRQLIIARRNQQVSDLAFKQQVIEVVNRILGLYWDLVTLRNNRNAARESLRLAEKLYEDNKRRVEIGTLAPIEIVRAEAEVAARQEELTIAETQVQLEETLLKNALSKTGIASPSLMYTEVIPTDEIRVPAREDIGPVQDLMATALRERPTIEQSRIRLGNFDHNLKAIRNGMLPQLNVTADFTNNGLAGRENPQFIPIPGQSTDVLPFFTGGLGTTLGQIFRRNFPDYQVGASLSIPIRNRAAQADMAATLLEKRQEEIRLVQGENVIRVEVQNAVMGLQQARARYDSSVKSRQLQQQTLEAEQKKFDLGASTIFLVVQAQRDLALARSQEIAAMNNYVLAKVELDRATGLLLEAYDITLTEAYDGTVRRPADPLPNGQQ